MFVFSFFLDAIMERSEHGYGRMRRNPGVSPLRTAVRRIVGMALLWLGFGIVVGYLTAPDQTPIGIAAGVIAGMIVLPPLGAVLGAAMGAGYSGRRARADGRGTDSQPS